MYGYRKDWKPYLAEFTWRTPYTAAMPPLRHSSRGLPTTRPHAVDERSRCGPLLRTHKFNSPYVPCFVLSAALKSHKLISLSLTLSPIDKPEAHTSVCFWRCFNIGISSLKFWIIWKEFFPSREVVEEPRWPGIYIFSKLFIKMFLCLK